MATREVSAGELRHAQIDGWRNRLGGADHLSIRELGDGRAVYLGDLLFGALRVGIGSVGKQWYSDVWEYEAAQMDAAWRAALGWDGEGEPEGWYRHPQTGRRRPGGDAAKEHIPED